MTSSPWFDAEREQQMRAWLSKNAPDLQAPRLAASDASPRRYWRLNDASGASWILMDAPPAHNELAPFLDVQQRLLAAGLRAPICRALGQAEGFLLLSDLGEQTYLPTLQQARASGEMAQAEGLMRAAIESLVQLQAKAQSAGLPSYDNAMIERELALFPEWCVAREFGVVWGAREQQWWQAIQAPLQATFAAQPQVLVHCDYMPRNLMRPALEGGAPGLLDFQDAVQGPAGYDMASLLRDAFVSWDEDQELDWAIRYWEAARRAGIAWSADFHECWRAIEYTALQRHLRILGVFCRLKQRDGKAHYCEDLPRFLAYCVKTATRYRELGPLVPLLEQLRPGATQQAYG